MDNIVLLNGIEYTGSSQLAITAGGVSGYLLGVEAVREFNVLTDTYSAEYGKRSAWRRRQFAEPGIAVAEWASHITGWLRTSPLNSVMSAHRSARQTRFHACQVSGRLWPRVFW